MCPRSRARGKRAAMSIATAATSLGSRASRVDHNSALYKSSRWVTTTSASSSSHPSAGLPLSSSSFGLDASTPIILKDRPVKRKHTRKREEGHIPRPPNAFMLFRMYAIDQKLIKVDKQTNVSRASGELWNQASEELREKFRMEAAERKNRHIEQYPDYKYTPRKNHVDAVTSPAILRTRRPGAGVKDAGTSSLSEASRKRLRITGPARDTSTREPPKTSEAFVLDTNPRALHSVVPDSTDSIGPANIKKKAESNVPFVCIFGDAGKPSINNEHQIPELSPDASEKLIISNLHVPCLASSAFYNPSCWRTIRAVQVPKPSSTQLIEEQIGESDIDDYDRAIRDAQPFLLPTVPSWHNHDVSSKDDNLFRGFLTDHNN